ncbi:MAG: hypothetical protein IJ214_00245, partial [Clostridia bacterium]|nr:hypothetical protein [Clostridia bacterium]
TGGEIDLLNKVMREDVIREGMAAIQDGFQMSNYPRDGLSYISFCCERDTVKDKAVRQAIAWCLDRSQLAEDYTAGFGLRVDGYFGIGQWMYGVVNGTIEPPVDPPEDANDQQAQAEYEAALAAYEELSLGHLTQYTVNLDRARALLEGDGWRLNDDGIREKDGVTLDLTLIYPEDNKIGELLDGFIDNLAAVGIQLTLEPMDMNDLLRQWYKQDERDNDMFFLASNFALVFDPSVSFSLNAEGEPNWSYTNHTDAELYHLALEMRRTEPGDVLAYCRRWVAFQERFNDTLPMLPIYSNIYFDFYREDLQNYAITENISWSQAIIPAYFGIPEDNQEDLFEDETWNEDLIAFDD